MRFVPDGPTVTWHPPVESTVEFHRQTCPGCGAAWDVVRQGLACDCPPVEFERVAEEPQAVLSLPDAELLAERTLAAIDGHNWYLDMRAVVADRKRVASDLAGLREHQSCGKAEKGVWITNCIAVDCPDARRYSDGLLRTAALYGVTS